MKKIVTLLFVLIASASLWAQSFPMLEILKPTDGKLKKYEKLELGVRLPISFNEPFNAFLGSGGEEGVNPFDPDEIDIRVRFTHGSDTLIRYAFFTQEFTADEKQWNKAFTQIPWRVRTTFPTSGEWIGELIIEKQGKPWEAEVIPENLVLNVDESILHGALVVSDTNDIRSRYLKHQDGSSFFAIGENLCWSGYEPLNPSLLAQHLRWIDELADAGGNFARISLVPWNMEFEWKQLNQYDLQRCHAIDKIFDKLEKREVYTIMFLEIHNQFQYGEEWKTDRWEINPYRNLTDVEEPLDFFTNNEARNIYKKKLRYFMARWGYSNYTGIVELLSEVENAIPGYNKKQDDTDERRAVFHDWFIDMRNYIQQYYNKPVSVSFASHEASEIKHKVYPLADVMFIHDYGQNEEQNRGKRYNNVSKLLKHRTTENKPILIEEMGGSNGGVDAVSPDSCTDLSFHNNIWATSFMGSFGCGLNWWWDHAIHKHGYQKNFKPIAIFFGEENMDESGYEPDVRHDRYLEQFMLVSEDKTHAIGWVHNRSAYFYNLRETNEKIKYWLPRHDDHPPKDYKKAPEEFVALKDEKVKLKNVKSGFLNDRQYKLKWFDTRTGQFFKTETVEPNMWGNIKTTLPPLDDIHQGDVAFKLMLIEE